MIRALCFLIASWFFAFSYAGEKRALIVAIGNYQASSGWTDLSSANDAILMRTTLRLQGFKDKNIITLADDRATKSNILSSLEKLISQSNKGDVVVFHFSGHGQQIVDQNGDELDGYDEALIPYDAQKIAFEKYHGENHLLDDEINGILYRLREQVGRTGDVVFFLDACHSGTATRGAEDGIICRGSGVPFGYLITDFQKQSRDSGMFNEQQYHKTRGNADLSPFVVISASGQQELNMEIKDQNNTGYGSLTFALGKVLATNREKLIYAGLFDLLSNEMCVLFSGRHQQTPQLEGQTDRLLFAGNQMVVPEHCRVISVVNSAKAIVDIGELSGLTPGSEISFYPINAVNMEKEKLLGKGIVKLVGLAESEISFSEAIEKEQLKDAWGYVTTCKRSIKYANNASMRSDMVRQATAKETSLNVFFEMVDTKAAGTIPFNHPFNIGDTFQLRVINNGTRDAFFQIIDIQPDNQINLVFDVSKHTPNDLYIKAGQSKLVKTPTIRIAPPVGVEMFKLVASEKQLDLSAIQTTQSGNNRSGQPNEFEQLLNELNGNDRGERAIGTFTKINIFTRTFTIKEK